MATTKKVTEQILGLPQAPDGGRFVVRKADKVEVPGSDGENVTTDPTYSHKLFLVVPDEGEYSVDLQGFEDYNVSNAANAAIQVRRGELRKAVFNSNDEVELTQ